MRNSRRAGKPAGRKPEKHGLTGLFTKGKNIPTTAQQTLPYREMYRDGVCRVADRYYTKTIEYEDINYQLAQSEDQAAIFDGWSACLNYFDSSLPFQLSYVTHTNSGEGLLFFGNTTIPFVDRFPQNTELYAIMTTRPEDKKQEMNRA